LWWGDATTMGKQKSPTFGFVSTFSCNSIIKGLHGQPQIPYPWYCFNIFM
jgi:hypothetical protein